MRNANTNELPPLYCAYNPYEPENGYLVAELVLTQVQRARYLKLAEESNLAEFASIAASFRFATPNLFRTKYTAFVFPAEWFAFIEAYL